MCHVLTDCVEYAIHVGSTGPLAERRKRFIFACQTRLGQATCILPGKTRHGSERWLPLTPLLVLLDDNPLLSAPFLTHYHSNEPNHPGPIHLGSPSSSRHSQSSGAQPHFDLGLVSLEPYLHVDVDVEADPGATGRGTDSGRGRHAHGHSGIGESKNLTGHLDMEDLNKIWEFLNLLGNYIYIYVYIDISGSNNLSNFNNPDVYVCMWQG